MGAMSVAKLEPPRFEQGKPMLIAGLRERYSSETMKDIPAQWQRFAPLIGSIKGRIGRAAFGVVSCLSGEDGCNYTTGVHVSDLSGLPADFSHVSVPARRYAVFAHRDHVSTIASTIDAIWSKWLPRSGYEAAGAPDLIEVYGEEFDPRTGTGGIEIWLPIKG
jgi:AraC family transcriptional regulator